MQVLYGEGVATHPGPESCPTVRKGRGEALAGERVGWPLSRERCTTIGGPTQSCSWKATPGLPLAQGSSRPPRGQRPQHARTLLTRESGDPSTGRGKMAPRSVPGTLEGAIRR